MRHVVNEAEVFRVPVPQSTETYKAISNAEVISSVKEHARKSGFQISDMQYRMNRGGQQMSGIYKLDTSDKEMSMMLGFYNSYDKSRRFGVGTGALVNICYNGMIMADFVSMRKHTGSIQDEMDQLIANAIQQIKPQYEEAQEEKIFLQGIPIEDPAIIHELVGEMYLKEELLGAHQLKVLKDSMENEDNPFRIVDDSGLIPGVTMWNFYNLVTESYKREPAIDFVDKHVDFHSYIKNTFDGNNNTGHQEETPEIVGSIH